MKKKLISLFIICIILLNSNISIGQNLGLSGDSYILMDAKSGRILLEKNSNKKMPMASTTKIMTALIAIEEGSLQDKVSVDDKSLNVEGSSIYLEKNEIMSLEDLIYGLMLRSGNDSSIAIANHISKTEKEFVDKMNAKAKLIGADNTQFQNPHGLDEENHYSTAYDLAMITKEALKYDEFKKIFETKTYNANREKNNYFINKNKTLWQYEGGNGGKTGYTRASGRCLVSTAQRDGMDLIAVSLNAYDWFNDNYKLMDYGFEKYKPYVIYDKNQLIKKMDIHDEKPIIYGIASNEFIYPLTNTEKDDLSVKLNLNKNFNKVVEKGEKVGMIETYLEGVLIKEEDIVSKNKVKRYNMIENLFRSR